MYSLVLTQYGGSILGPIAKVLGILMDAIFNFLEMISIPNIGLAIILFTIVIYLLMTPLTIKQQKFSKLSAKMNPEIKAIQKKYANKKDNDSMMAMNQETQAIYKKYGVSPTGSCLQMLIQMPILFALYRVIYAIPAYVGKVKDAFFPLVDELIAQEGGIEFVQNFKTSAMYQKQFTNELFTNPALAGHTEYVQNTIVDALNRASSTDWASLSEKFTGISADINNTLTQLNEYNNFLGLNAADSPSVIIRESVNSGAWLLVIGALLIPLLSALTQWINTKLMPQPSSGTDGQDTMASSMKTMNTMMPIMSAIFCFTLPVGMGIYWIAGAVIRSIQQVAINRHIDKIDMDELIKKNLEKQNKKREKQGLPPQTLSNNARINTKNMTVSEKPQISEEERREAVKKATEYYNQTNPKGYKPGSIAAKANMVKQYNERNNK